MPPEEFHRIRRLPPYVFAEVNTAKARARTAGEDIIDLGMGNPDSPTPPHIVAKLVEAVQDPRTHRYSVSKGIPGLHRALAGYYDRRFGVALDPETEVVVTLGSKEGLANLASAITSPGDTILVPNPSYPIHQFGFIISESYLDTGNREMFENTGLENAAQPMVVHPDFAAGQQARVSRSRLPFADRPDQVEPVWRALADRAEALGWAVPRPVWTDDPDLHVRVGTRRINPVAVRDGRYTFVLPPCGTPITLASRAARPSEARPWIADDRLLGARVRRLVHRSGDAMRVVAMDDPALDQGWWAVETDGSWPCRWTSGDALLPFLGAGVLEVELSSAKLYPATSTVPVMAALPDRAAA